MTVQAPSWFSSALSIARMEGKKILFSLAHYLAISVSLFVAWLMLNSLVNSVQRVGLVVETNPFLLPFFAALVPYMIFLAIAVALTLTREIESRTIEVLFYAPLDFSSFVLGRFLGQITYFLIALPFLVFFFLGYAFQFNLRMTAGLFGAMILSPFTVACVIAFGILTASIFRKVRMTAIVLIIAIALLLVVQIAHVLLPVLQVQEGSQALFLFTEVIEIGYRVVEWISPFAFLARGVEAAEIGAPSLYGLVVLKSIIYTGICVLISVLLLKYRGISK